MNQISKWFDGLVAEAERTDDGLLFKAAGFKLEYTGGGCTAWRRSAVDGYFILITDSTGAHHRLGDCHAADFSRPDLWWIGLHLDDGDHLEGSEVATVSEAIASAQELDEGARQFAPPGD